MHSFLTAMGTHKNRLAHKGAWFLMSMETLTMVKHSLSSLSEPNQKSGRQLGVPAPVQHLLSRHADTLTILGSGFVQEHTKTVEAFEPGYWRIVNTTGGKMAEGWLDVKHTE